MDQKTPAVVCHVEFELPADRLAEYLVSAKELHAVVSKEDGFIRYDINNLASSPCKFILYEEWASLADLEKHLKNENVLNLLKPWFPVFVPGSFKLDVYEVKGRYVPPKF